MEKSIFITTSEHKSELLKKQNILTARKIFTIAEVKKILLGSVSDTNILALANSLEIGFSRSKTYIDNILKIKPSALELEKLSSKLNELKELASYIKENDYIETDFRRELFKTNRFVLYGYRFEFIELIPVLDFFDVSYSFEEVPTGNGIRVVNCYRNEKEEIVEALNRIADLLTKGAEIEDFIIVAPNHYHNLIRLLGGIFNLPIEEKTHFLSEVPQFKSILDKIKEQEFTSYDLLSVDGDSEIIDFVKLQVGHILDSISNVIISPDLKVEYLKDKSRLCKLPKIKNGIELSSTFSMYHKYTFVLGFGEKLLISYKDRDYLSDDEKRKFTFELTSYEKNELGKKVLASKLLFEANVFISKCEQTGEDNETPLFSDNPQFIEEAGRYQTRRFCKMADLFIYSDYELNARKYHLHTDYGSYLKGLNLGEVNSFKNEVILNRRFDISDISFSSISKYFECPFHYYLSKLCQLDEQEDNFSIKLGNITHLIMEYYNRTNKLVIPPSFPTVQLSAEESFYVKKCLKSLEKRHNEITAIHSFAGFSREIEYPFSIPLINDVRLVGRFDLLLVHENYFLIIDYKTGAYSFDFDLVKHDFGTQLPIYALAGEALFSSKTCLGSFVAPLIELKASKPLNLVGFTAFLDELKEANPLITTVLKKRRESKKLNFEDINTALCELKGDIINAVTKIQGGDVKIAPKKIGSSIHSCRYCQYKDICFVKSWQVEEISLVRSSGGDSDE